MDMLENYDVNWMLVEKQRFANAINFLLISAALIASITYASWLQPPLDFTPNIITFKIKSSSTSRKV